MVTVAPLELTAFVLGVGQERFVHRFRCDHLVLADAVWRRRGRRRFGADGGHIRDGVAVGDGRRSGGGGAGGLRLHDVRFGDHFQCFDDGDVAETTGNVECRLAVLRCFPAEERERERERPKSFMSRTTKKHLKTSRTDFMFNKKKSKNISGNKQWNNRNLKILCFFCDKIDLSCHRCFKTY